MRMPSALNTCFTNAQSPWQSEFVVNPEGFYALLLGYSVFTTFRSDASPCWRRTHLKRLYEQGKVIGLALPCFREFAEALEMALESFIPPTDALIFRCRLTLFPWQFQLKQKPPFQAACWMILEAIETSMPWSLPLASGTAVVVDYEQAHPTLKHGSQLPSVLWQAHSSKSETVLWRNRQGEITESTHANLFYVHRQWGYCNPPRSQALAGVTRQQVLKAGRKIGISIQERPLTTADLGEIDALFLTNSVQGWQLMDAWSVENHLFTVAPSMEVQRHLQDLYQAWHRLAFDAGTSCYAVD
jgi:branched-subunit amino acid aminotransferase/4-amino-4-deoxychorismate lyase